MSYQDQINGLRGSLRSQEILRSEMNRNLLEAQRRVVLLEQRLQELSIVIIKYIEHEHRQKQKQKRGWFWQKK